MMVRSRLDQEMLLPSLKKGDMLLGLPVLPLSPDPLLLGGWLDCFRAAGACPGDFLAGFLAAAAWRKSARRVSAADVRLLHATAEGNADAGRGAATNSWILF